MLNIRYAVDLLTRAVTRWISNPGGLGFNTIFLLCAMSDGSSDSGARFCPISFCLPLLDPIPPLIHDSLSQYVSHQATTTSVFSYDASSLTGTSLETERRSSFIELRDVTKYCRLFSESGLISFVWESYYFGLNVAIEWLENHRFKSRLKWITFFLMFLSAFRHVSW